MGECLPRPVTTVKGFSEDKESRSADKTQNLATGGDMPWRSTSPQRSRGKAPSSMALELNPV